MEMARLMLAELLVAGFCLALTRGEMEKAPALRGQTTGDAVQEVRVAKEAIR